MSNHIRRLIEGVQQALVIDPGSSYIVPQRGDFHLDNRALRGDARQVANGLRTNAKKVRHESSNTRRT